MKPSLLSRLFVASLLFAIGFAAGRYFPGWEAWTDGPAIPLNVPAETRVELSPQEEARIVMEQLSRRARELQRREALLQRSTQEDRTAYQILKSQDRCEDACQRLLDRIQRREEEQRDVRRQLDELKELEQRVRRVADRADGPAEEGIDPALVSARALLLRTGEAERPIIPDERWKDGERK